MFGIIGKIKNALLAILAVMLPLFYVLGRKDGGKEAKNDVLADDLEAQKKVSDFYKAMAEDAEDFNPTSRSDLTDRLRRDGL
jgi:hypothetical protein